MNTQDAGQELAFIPFSTASCVKVDVVWKVQPEGLSCYQTRLAANLGSALVDKYGQKPVTLVRTQNAGQRRRKDGESGFEDEAPCGNVRR